jgi:hypothetical protein
MSLCYWVMAWNSVAGNAILFSYPDIFEIYNKKRKTSNNNVAYPRSRYLFYFSASLSSLPPQLQTNPLIQPTPNPQHSNIPLKPTQPPYNNPYALVATYLSPNPPPPSSKLSTYAQRHHTCLPLKKTPLPAHPAHLPFFSLVILSVPRNVGKGIAVLDRQEHRAAVSSTDLACFVEVAFSWV